MRVDESWQARVYMRVVSTVMSWSNENKSCMRVDESWQARVYMRVFSTVMSWSNENKSSMKVEKWVDFTRELDACCLTKFCFIRFVKGSKSVSSGKKSRGSQRKLRHDENVLEQEQEPVNFRQSEITKISLVPHSCWTKTNVDMFIW